MAKINKSVYTGQQAGKIVMSGMMTAQEMVELLRAKTLSVNENAQR